MRHRTLCAVATLWMAAAAAHAHADRIHLVGGTIIEGKATRQGDKVVVEVESGELALPADEVKRIEIAESDVQRADAMYGKLAPRDVEGLIAFANFCRDHGMGSREQMALERVIDVAPDHAQARARLGYVRANGAWIKREAQMREQGMVEYEGKWITRAELLQLERLHAEAETARLARDKAQADAKKAEAEAEAERARTERTAAAAATPPLAVPVVPPYPAYSWPAAYPVPYSYTAPGYGRCEHGRHGRGCSDEPPPPRAPHSVFPIPGARDPFVYFR
jgi:hypothetical protein